MNYFEQIKKQILNEQIKKRQLLSKVNIGTQSTFVLFIFNLRKFAKNN